jgi:hypothetical protein
MATVSFDTHLTVVKSEMNPDRSVTVTCQSENDGINAYLQFLTVYPIADDCYTPGARLHMTIEHFIPLPDDAYYPEGAY